MGLNPKVEAYEHWRSLIWPNEPIDTQPQLSPDQQPIDVEFPLTLSACRDGARLLLNELVIVEREVDADGVYGSNYRNRIEECSKICNRLFDRIGKLQDMLRLNAEAQIPKEHQ